MPLNLIFIQPGTYTIEDNGVPGDNISVIKDQNGVVIFSFGHPADALGFTVSTPGVNIIVNFTDSMNAANFTIGNLTNSAECPDSIVIQNIETTGTVTLVTNGSITEGTDVDLAPDITAGAIVLSAVTGIGTASNAIETRTGLFEAETTTGGITISNFGSVQIGGVSANVDGLDVATSGNISFTTVGSIFLTEANSVTAGEVVHGGGSSGNVSLTALGANSDIIGNVDNGAATAARGEISFTAGRDIQLGTIGADFNNDLVSNNSLALIAGRDILIDGFADVLSDNFGLDTGGNLFLIAGRNVGILNVAGTSASVTASGSGGGDIFVNTGPGGTLTVNGPGSFALGSTSGDVNVSADRILIDAASGISAPAGSINIRTTTAGRTILLGSGTDAALAMELSNTELNRIFTPNTLTIGANDGGVVRVVGVISPISAGNAPNLILRSSTAVQVEANVTVLNSLVLFSYDDVFQSAASVITAPTLSVFADAIDDDPLTGGVATMFGTISGTNFINGNVDSDRLTGTGGANIINGGAGPDIMAGRGGDDIYIVDNAGDAVREVAGEGFDTIFTLISFTLPEFVERLGVNGSSTTFAINLTGNTLNNEMLGNNGPNIIDGAGGADLMQGFGGDDIYVVDNAGDAVSESAGAGFDTIFTSVTYTLGPNVERIGVNGSTTTFAINLTGNGLNTEIIGNDGVNILDGGSGADIFSGLGGNDTYIVDNIGDVINEAPGGGLDTVLTNVNYTLGANVDRLFAQFPTSTSPLSLIGNGIANEITGNDGPNVINGGLGADVLFGRGDGDAFFFTTALGGGNIDQIIDFQVGLDKMALDDAIFTGLPTGALAAGAFRSGTSAGDADDRIIYDPVSGALFFDPDGTGAAAQVQFASLSSGLGLGASDFVVV
jgi:hypothetical protein